jgi:hypothetical protein
MVPKTYGFCHPKGMGYGLLRIMGYGKYYHVIPVHRVGGQPGLWVLTLRGYGLSEVWSESATSRSGKDYRARSWIYPSRWWYRA